MRRSPVALNAPREHALRMRLVDSAPRSDLARGWGSALLALCAMLAMTGCAGDSLGDGSMILAQRPQPVDDEVWRQELTRIDTLIAEEREDEAVEAVAAALEREPPASMRAAFQASAAFARKQRFHRRHPLFLELAFDRERYTFGDTAVVTMTLVNLGSETLTMPREHRSWFEAATLQSGESSTLTVQWKADDADGRGSEWSAEASFDVPLDHDLVLAPGARETIETTLQQEAMPDVVMRRVVVSAILRPVALISSSSDRRYDPLQFPEASARVFRANDAHLLVDGLDQLRDALGGEAPPQPASIFVLAMGLPEADLHAGLDLMARAAPSLDDRRRRPVVAALRRLSGKLLADDPVRYLDWWTTEGAALEPDELAELAGFRARSAQPRLAFDKATPRR